MSEQDIFFSILVERLIQIRYKADRGLNPNIVTVYNPKGWTLHIQRLDNRIDISGYKLTKRYLKESITDFSLSNIDIIVLDINSRF
jgi:hypothetical protein